MKVETTRSVNGDNQYLRCEMVFGDFSEKWHDAGFSGRELSELEDMFLILFGQINQKKCTPQKVRFLCQEVVQTVANWRKAYMKDEPDET